MDKSELKEIPLEANCFYINKWSYDRSILEGVVKAEEVVDNGITLYNPNRAYCSFAREKPDFFREACPQWFGCRYANGQTYDVKPKSAE